VVSSRSEEVGPFSASSVRYSCPERMAYQESEERRRQVASERIVAMLPSLRGTKNLGLLLKVRNVATKGVMAAPYPPCQLPLPSCATLAYPRQKDQLIAGGRPYLTLLVVLCRPDRCCSSLASRGPEGRGLQVPSAFRE
jgi:hypothetical protein